MDGEFVYSQQTILNEQANEESYLYLTKVEFLEFIVRLAINYDKESPLEDKAPDEDESYYAEEVDLVPLEVKVFKILEILWAAKQKQLKSLGNGRPAFPDLVALEDEYEDED